MAGTKGDSASIRGQTNGNPQQGEDDEKNGRGQTAVLDIAPNPALQSVGFFESVEFGLLRKGVHRVPSFRCKSLRDVVGRTLSAGRCSLHSLYYKPVCMSRACAVIERDFSTQSVAASAFPRRA